MNSEIIKQKNAAVWGATPAGSTFAIGLTPGTKEYFETSRKRRAEYEMPWLYTFFPFTNTYNKKILEIGCGAGYDAYEFCKNNAEYTGIDLASENIDRTKAHLAHYGYTEQIEIGDAEDLKFSDNTFDVVFSNGVLHHTPNILKAFQEAHRTLKPQGQFWFTVYNKNSVFYWGYIFLCEHILRRGYKKRTIQQRLSMIEYTTSTEKPLVNVYSKKTIKKLLALCGFTVKKIAVRKLAKEDLPFPLMLIPSKLLPQKLLDFVGKFCGWYLVIQAYK